MTDTKPRAGLDPEGLEKLHEIADVILVRCFSSPNSWFLGSRDIGHWTHILRDVAIAPSGKQLLESAIRVTPPDLPSNISANSAKRIIFNLYRPKAVWRDQIL